MLRLDDNKIHYTYSYCQQCGACKAVCPKGAISFEALANGLKNIVVDEKKCITCKKCVRVCPANREQGYEDYFDSLKDKKYFFAYNENKRIRHDSSSGGACKTLIIESLKNGVVDGVYSLRRLENYPSAVGEFYTRENLPSYDTLPNSVYHSVMACTELSKVKKVHRLMIVGTSCQLYALEKSLKGKFDELIKICIFCKQQKHLGSTRWLAKAMGNSIPENLIFSTRYRGEGWPGNLRVMGNQLPWNRAAGFPFGRRLWTVPGCNICGDPFGCEVGADVSLMDPWSIRQENDLGETLVSVHTVKGLDLIKNTVCLVTEEKCYEEIRPALGEKDIWRKRIMVPFFRGEKVSADVERAAKEEIKQRKQLERLLEFLPRMPFVFYRVLNRIIPKKRDLTLK